MKKVFIVCILLVLVAIIGFGWWNNGLSPVNPSEKTQKIFVVQKGSGIKQIAKDLKNEGLIRDHVVFYLLVKNLNLDQKIQAGTFRLSPSQSAETIAKNLTVGILDMWVTIPEGKRAEEIANILKETIPTYEVSWRETLIENEGYLFPDTYLIPKDASNTMIVSLLTNTFNQRYTTIKNKTNLSQAELVTLASLIEREAKFDADRGMISSVMHNRLDLGMKLDIDATVQYALGYDYVEKTWWRKNITFADLQIASPYNTYRNASLPPTPIANPGLKALQAAANPVNTEYLFYFTDKSGKNRYSRTNEEHNAQIKKYGL